MIRLSAHKLFAPLRITIISLWIFSLVGVGISPLYYVSTPDSSANAASAVDKSIDSNKSNKSLALRFTYNPFKIQPSDSDEPIESGGGIAGNLPVGSPVVLWLVSASANGTVASSNLNRIYQYSDQTNIFTPSNSTNKFTTTVIEAEHPSKLAQATLLGQKPSGVS